MKPVRGGRPPSESKVRAAVTVRVGLFDHDSASVLIFVVVEVLNVKKAVEVIII